MQNQKFLLQPTSGALSAFIDRWLRVPFVLMGSNIENVNRTALEKLSLSTSKEKENADGEEKPSNSNELLYLLTCLFPCSSSTQPKVRPAIHLSLSSNAFYHPLKVQHPHSILSQASSPQTYQATCV